MSKYKVSMSVTWKAWGDVEVEAASEDEARREAEWDHPGIGVDDAEEIDADVDSIECLEESEPEEIDFVPKEQIALPGCESLVAGVARR